ncbi:MAG: hypothetical protein EOO88_49390, partial [Pedobacter sp.]
MTAKETKAPRNLEHSTRSSSSFQLIWHNSRIIVGFITLFGAVLRIYHLGYKPLWFDEAALYMIAKGNFQEVIQQNALGNSAPPTFAVLLSLMMMMGDSKFNLRLISCIAGILAIPSIYFLSRQFLPKSSSYFCSLLLAISQQQIAYSQQVREYSVAFTLATLTIALFYKYLRDPIWQNWSLMTILFVVGVFTQYGLALLILSLSLVWLYSLVVDKEKSAEQRKRIVVWWLGSQICVLVAAIAVYFVSLRYQMKSGGFGASSNFNYLSSGYWDGSTSSFFKLAFNNTK